MAPKKKSSNQEKKLNLNEEDEDMELIQMETGKVDSRAVLFTYAQSEGLKLKDVKDFFSARYKDALYLIVEEAHEDGSPHIHAYIERENDNAIRGCIKTSFDIVVDGENFHPNVKRAKKKTRLRIMMYLLKQQNLDSYDTPEQDFLYNMDENLMLQAITLIKEKQILCKKEDMSWMTAINLAEAGNYLQAVGIIRKCYPREFVLNHNEVVKTLRGIYKVKQQVYPLESFDIPPGVTHWMQLYKDVRSLYIYGKGDSGKTQMARSILQKLIDDKYPGKGYTFFACHGFLDELQHYNPSVHKGVLIDDIKIRDRYSPEDTIQLVSEKDPSTIKCRYRNGLIPGGHFKIITQNQSFENWIPTIEDDFQEQAIYNRVVVVRIPDNKKLFEAPVGKLEDWKKCNRLIFDDLHPPPNNYDLTAEQFDDILNMDSLNDNFLPVNQPEVESEVESDGEHKNYEKKRTIDEVYTATQVVFDSQEKKDESLEVLGLTLAQEDEIYQSERPPIKKPKLLITSDSVSTSKRSRCKSFRPPDMRSDDDDFF